MNSFTKKKRHLTAQGFRFLKQCKHGEIWSDGKTRITFSRSTNHAHEFIWDVEAAVKLRKSVNTTLDQFFPKPPSARLPAIVPVPIVESVAAPEPEKKEKISMSTTGKSYRKYTAMERAKVWRRIEDLSKTMNGVQIAEQMEKEGFLLPDTKTPMNPMYVNATLRHLSRAGIVVGKESATETKKTYRLSPTAVGILTDPDLSDGQKVRMLIAYAEI